MNTLIGDIQSLKTRAPDASIRWRTSDGRISMQADAWPERHEIQLRRILVPVDLSGATFSSLDYAASLSRGMDSAVTLFHVARVDLSEAAHARLTPEQLHKNCQSLLAHLQMLADRYWRGERRVDVAVAVGDPCTEIVRQALDLDADLIVMTTKRCRGILRLVHSDTTLKVMRLAPCTVMVARFMDHGDGLKPACVIAA